MGGGNDQKHKTSCITSIEYQLKIKSNDFISFKCFATLMFYKKNLHCTCAFRQKYTIELTKQKKKNCCFNTDLMCDCYWLLSFQFVDLSNISFRMKNYFDFFCIWSIHSSYSYIEFLIGTRSLIALTFVRRSTGTTKNSCGLARICRTKLFLFLRSVSLVRLRFFVCALFFFRVWGMRVFH